MRRQRLRHLAGAAAEIGHDPFRGQQAEERLLREGLPVQLLAQAIPTAGGAREEALVRLPLGQAPREPELVLRDRRPVVGLLARQRPQAARGRIRLANVHPIEVGGSLRPAAHPSFVGQYLEVPTDRRLRELQDVAQLGHPELVPLEQTQLTQAGGVGQRLHPAQQGLRLARRGGGRGAALRSHQSIRMKG